MNSEPRAAGRQALSEGRRIVSKSGRPHIEAGSVHT